MRQMIRIFFAIVAVCLLGAAPASAEDQGLVAIVNDHPVTEYDISQRITLLKILGDTKPEALSRKKSLQSLVDDQVKNIEAKKYNMTATEADITGHIARISKGMNTDAAGLLARLKKAGISEVTFRAYIATQIGFNRIIGSRYRENIKVAPGDIDRKTAEIKSTVDNRMSQIMNDPRMKGVTVYEIMEIILPVDANDSALLQARAVEAAQFQQRFKGCGNVKAAAAGIFDVRPGKKIEADGAKLPRPMKAALDKAGPGRAIGPMRGKGGIQLLAFCGLRKITPPKPNFQMPTRQQIENMLVNEKYDGLEEEYMKTARQSVYVEYRNDSYSQ